MIIFALIGIPFIAVGAFSLYTVLIGDAGDLTLMWGIFAATFLPIGLLLLWVGSKVRKSAANAQKLMLTGSPGTAKIISANQQANTEMNNQPVITFRLQVMPGGGAPFEVTLRTTVTHLQLSQVRVAPGAELPIRYDAADPSNFIIDWATATMQESQAQAQTGTS